MGGIYKPKGRALEYSPLALNVYDGCSFGCVYCYTKHLYGKDTRGGRPFPNIIERAMEDAKKYRGGPQVLLSFLSDPYCDADVEFQYTREVLKIFAKYDVAVAILSKGGRRLLRDVDVYKKVPRIKVGATIVFADDNVGLRWEPLAARVSERMEVLKLLKQEGLRTWISLEPVIDDEQALKVIDKTWSFVDEYKIGKLNCIEEPRKIDWRGFVERAVERIRGYGRALYIKKDLQVYCRSNFLSEKEKDMKSLWIQEVKQMEVLI